MKNLLLVSMKPAALVFLSLSIFGCSHIPSRASASTTCDLSKTNTCETDQICMSAKPEPLCQAIPAKAPLTNLVLPFDSKTEVFCTHSSGEGSHSWPNAFYALDLAAKYNLPAPQVLAAADGKAFVFFGEDGKPCPEPQGTPQSAKADQCGEGWGNHVKILHENGYATFYVHLDKVLVKTGELVHQGQPIGVMGWTGLAGHRHLHFSVQKIPGSNQSEWESHISWDGQSVPFDFKTTQDGKISSISSANLKCPFANVGQVPEDQQPHMNGLKLPLCRADFPRVDQDLESYSSTVQQMNDAFSKIPVNPKDKVWVKKKIQHMYDVDQYMRHYLMETPFNQKFTDAETKCFQSVTSDDFALVDGADTADLKALLKIYPWFKISEFGKDTDQEAWIIVQHADLDPDFQAQVLKVLEPLVKPGETKPSNYAYLYDRVAASYSNPSKRKLQRYGTQGSCKGPSDWQPIEIEDPTNLDKRRAEMGLPPFSEYKKLVDQMCH